MATAAQKPNTLTTSPPYRPCRTSRDGQPFRNAEEQEILSKYVGLGGVAEAFDEHKAEWKKENNELKSMLSDDEYHAARESVLNAHYTSPTVIKAIYGAIENMGFKKGNGGFNYGTKRKQQIT